MLFLLMWGLSLAWMSTTYGHQRTALSQWSIRMAGTWIDAGSQLSEWSSLSESNRQVMLENARLRAELEFLKSQQRERWSVRESEILRSPGWNQSPWMILDRGGRDGISPGTAVLSMGHAAGKVVDTTAHEAMVLTLIHPGAQWSVRVGSLGPSGRLVHESEDIRRARVLDIPWAHLVLPGDSVLTTGFDGVFPADIPVGFVIDVTGNEADEFQTVHIELGANYPSSRHALCLTNPRKERIDSLIVHASPSTTP